MKKIVILLSCFSLALMVMSCMSTVPAGYRGIKVYLLGNKKGVQEEQLGVGAYFMGFNQKLYIFPVFQQNYVWDGVNSITFQSKEGLDVRGDFGISYSLVADSVPAIFQKYRRGIEEITNIFLKNMVRDALNTTSSRMPIESIYGVHKKDLLLKVDSMVSLQTRKYGIIIDRIYTVGELHLPPSIENAITAKLEANQKSQQSLNEVKAVEAEANKLIVRTKADAESKVLEAKAAADVVILQARADSVSKIVQARTNADARIYEVKAEASATQISAEANANAIRITGEAQAEANKKLSGSISKELIDLKAVEQWNGQVPQITTQNLPFVNLNALKP